MSLALKEWHVVAEAIGRGDQLVTIRKGGIAEKAFALAGAEFWLFPTWEHQRAEQVKRAWHGELARSNRERRGDGRIPLRCHCTAVAAWELTQGDALDALDGTHLWTRDYVTARLNWRPTKPLTVVLLRASALVEPTLVAASDAYGGCRSWVELDDELPVGSVVPSLTDDAFALHAGAVHAALGTPTVAV